MIRRVVGAALLATGLLGVLVGGGAYVGSWYVQWGWSHSLDRERARRQADASAPLWIDAQAAPPPPSPTAEPAVVPLPDDPRPADPPPPATAPEIELQGVDFRFLDPPEPGAHARLAATLRSRAAAPSDRVLLGVAARWFDDFQVIGAVPAVADDRVEDDGYRYFAFPGLAAEGAATLELHVAAAGESVDPPEVQLRLAGGGPIGQARPRTAAPRPRPGPVSLISIPRLDVRSGVIQTSWEPPPFVVGQIRGSANVSQGNTTLIGHLRGLAGDVFAHLDRVRPGDEIIAVSRGLDYPFVASTIMVRPAGDSSPLLPTDSPRLTLMTCAGRWNPITGDYSDRLWVIAEPPELAQVTIAANAERAAGATATAEAARPTVTPTPPPTSTPAPATPTPPPTSTPVPATPTPFAGQVALPGGLGNTRPDLDAAFGPPTGETPRKLVVYRQRSTEEYRVAFTPDPPRARLLARVLPDDAPLSLEDAVRESRELFPRDAEPRGDRPEGNRAFVVERFASPTLARAIPGEPFQEGAGQPGDFLVVYLLRRPGEVGQILLGLGDDVDAVRVDAAP